MIIPHKLIKVIWRDITAKGDQWSGIDEAIKWAKERFSAEYVTVGYLIYEDKDILVIAGTIADDKSYNDISMIMQSVVVGVTEI